MLPLGIAKGILTLSSLIALVANARYAVLITRTVTSSAPRIALCRRIDDRCDAMLRNGLLEASPILLPHLYCAHSES